MGYGFLDIATTPSVKAAQAANASADYWSEFQGNRSFDRFTDAEAAFIRVARQLLYGDRIGDWLALCPASRRSAWISPHAG